MPYERRDRTPVPKEDEKRSDFERIRSGVLSVLGKRNLLHAQPDEQVAAVVRYLKKADADSAIATDESDVEHLLAEIGSYSGSDVPGFVAECISAMFDREGRYSNKKSFQERVTVRKNAQRGFRMFPENYAFSYGLDPETRSAHIHLTNPYAEKGGNAPEGMTSALALRMFLKGLIQFCENVVEPDPSVRKITATSVILSRPEFVRFLEGLGFTNGGVIDPDLRLRHFEKESRPVIGLEASRESFLASMRDMDFKRLQAAALEALRYAKER